MKYSITELKAMPLNVLRNIDIRTAEEETVIQKIVNEKLASTPVKVDLGIINTDNMNAEKEAKLQAEIDAKRALAKVQFVAGGSEEIVVEPGVISVIEPEINPEVIPESVAPVIEPEVVPEAKINIVQHKPKFCEFCDSKAVRHKKNCTRPNK